MLKLIQQYKGISVVLACILLILLSGGGILLYSQLTVKDPTCCLVKGGPSIGPPLTWQIQNQLDSSEELSLGNNIKINAIMISPTSIRFFYSLKLGLPDQAATLSQFDIRTNSTIPGCDGNQTSSVMLNTQLQILGKLGDFEVGVIHVLGWTDHPGQIISLKLQLPSNTKNSNPTTLELPALQQINPVKQSAYMVYSLTSSDPSPNIVFSGTSGLDYDHQAGFFWLGETGKPVTSPPIIFSQIEHEDKVTVINQKDYINIAGQSALPQSFNSAEPYPATPTPPGYTPPTLKTPCQ